MNSRVRWIVSGALLAGLITGSGYGAGALASRALAGTTTPTVTPTETITVTTTPTSGTPQGSVTTTPTPGTPRGSVTATPTATPSGALSSPTPTSSGPSATPTRIRPKKFVANPTPIAARRKSITLPAPVLVQVGSKEVASGLTPIKAVALANHAAPQLQLTAPTYIPKNWILQVVHVDASQGLGFPPDGYLQYIPKSLKKVGGTYPSFLVTKQVGLAPIITPGSKVTPVVISKGVHGIGQVTGTIADLKLKNGYEIVHVTWSRLTVSYDVTSAIGLSKLSIKDLLAIAATVS
ncbi:MAG TPA: hypothetical protein VNL35_23585 [Chloroflexota bacterium]|nr:hypothetical protein [Chloroflexota bacterium]